MTGQRAVRVYAAVLPASCLVVMLLAWGVALPYWDQFALVPLLADAAGGEVDLARLWSPHNEHRLFFPQLTMVAMASVSGWSIHWELWLQVALAGLILGSVLLLFRRLEPGRSKAGIGLYFAASLLVFSPSQWENWIWGWQIQIFLVSLSAVVTVSALSLLRRAGPRVGAAALAATVGSFSFANGLLLWPVAAPLVLLGGSFRRGDEPSGEAGAAPFHWRRFHWRQLAAWCALGGLTWLMYFHGFRPSVDGGSGMGGIRALLHFGAYMVLYLASPLLRFHGPLALWGGFVVVGVALMGTAWLTWRAWKDGRPRAVVPWLTLAAFAAGSATLTGLGRLEYGIGQALSSRYVTIGNLFWFGVLGAFFALPGSSGLARRTRNIALALVTAALLVNAVHGARGFHRGAHERAEILRTIRETPASEIPDATLRRIYPSAEEARKRLETLEELEMGPYRP